MKKINGYCIGYITMVASRNPEVQMDTPTQCDKFVELLSEGWELWGKPSFCSDGGTTFTVFQAFVKYEG